MRYVIVLGLPCALGLIGLSKSDVMPKEARLALAQKNFERGVEKLRQPAEARRLFVQAAEDFDRLSGSVRSPAVYLSLGNAEALAGRWPRAVRAYHAGLKVDPNDRALRAHRDYARSLVHYPSGGRGRPTSDAWPAWLHRPTANELTVLAAIAWTLAWFAGGWWYLRRSSLSLYLTLSLAAIALLSGVGYWRHVQQTTYDARHPLVVVLEEGATLYAGNGPSYPQHEEMPTLPAGLEARVLHRRGRWLQIELTSGDVGWVPRDAVISVPD